MPSPQFDLKSLLTPLDAQAPCGAELDTADADFQALESASAGKPERQYGDRVFAAEPPDWPRVYELSLALLQRSRDLRLAVWLVRSGSRLQGLPGAMRGLQLVQGLLERHWEHVHPQLDTSDGNDPTMRMNALAALTLGHEALADLRAAGLSSQRGSLSLRELEIGLGRAEPHGDEARPTEAGVLNGLQALLQSDPGAGTAVHDAIAAVDAIAALLDAKVGPAAPDLTPLRKLLRIAGAALDRIAPAAATADSRPADSDQTEAAPSGRTFAPSSPGSRADVVRELDRLCDWFERHEPSHPAPLLLRRAQRLMAMSFLQIMEDMAPGAIEQVQTIAGVQPQ